MAPKRNTVILQLSTGLSIQKLVLSKPSQIYKRWLENESVPIIYFRFLRIRSQISKDQRENIICTIDDVRGDILGPPHGSTPAAVIANKNKTEYSQHMSLREK